MKNKLAIALFITILSNNIFAKNYTFLVGTYTKNTESQGIYNIEINPSNKHFEIISVFGGIQNPSFLTLSNNKKQVFAVSEDDKNSRISAFNFRRGILDPINSVQIEGEGSCFIDECKGFICVANYRSGNLAYAELLENKSIPSVLRYIQFEGKSIKSERQEKSHVHQSIFSPDGNYLFTNNLGTDYTHIFKFTPLQFRVLTPLDSIQGIMGGGSRHLAIHPKKEIIYVLNELSGEIAIISYVGEKLKLLDTISLIKKDLGAAGAADIHLSQDGKFLYASNRELYNNITCFKIRKDGSLSFVQQIRTQGNWPRNFALSQDDNYLFVANQKSNDITVFKRDKRTGKLQFTGIKAPLPSPVCLIEH